MPELTGKLVRGVGPPPDFTGRKALKVRSKSSNLLVRLETIQ